MTFRTSLLALALVFMAALSPVTAAAQGPTATISLHVVRGSYIFGLTGGHGVLHYQGRSYPISIGGASVGLSIGGSVADLTGTVYNLRSPWDIEGVYGAANTSYALAHHGGIGQSIQNHRGVVIHLQGHQVGLEFSLDVSGIALHLQ